MSKKVLVDTNLLIDNNNIIEKLSKQYDSKIIIPLTVLKELDKLKRKDGVGVLADKAIRSILKNRDKIELYVDNDAISINDDFISKAAKDNEAKLLTKDINMHLIASAKNIDNELVPYEKYESFNPYNRISVKDLYKIHNFEYKNEYIDCEYFNLIGTLNKVTDNYIDPDTWCFIFIKNYIYANNPINYKLVRIDNVEKYKK